MSDKHSSLQPYLAHNYCAEYHKDPVDFNCGFTSAPTAKAPGMITDEEKNAEDLLITRTKIRWRSESRIGRFKPNIMIFTGQGD
jgi:hypothetical protein